MWLCNIGISFVALEELCQALEHNPDDITMTFSGLSQLGLALETTHFAREARVKK